MGKSNITERICVTMSLHTHHINATPATCKSIFEMLEHVMQQVEYNCFVDRQNNLVDPLYKEICLVIAEVLALNPDSIVRINGSNMYAKLVQEVYSRLRHEHVEHVFMNFHNVSTRIYNKISYQRTALYNAVFEIEFDYVNCTNCV
jgi:hypothetical protein